jgi:signal transduction histidine kinase
VNVSKILREVAESFASRAEQSNRMFLMDTADEAVEVWGNETQLSQIFINLLDNALKFTQPNDTISVSTKLVEDVFEIRISDTGIGIPAEDLPNMFKRFHRGRNVSSITGNGLGLAIVKAVTEAHGGGVRVASTAKGSEFIVTLPTRL